MWCKTCSIETNENICPICGNETVEDLPCKYFGVTIVKRQLFRLSIKQIKVFALYVKGRQSTCLLISDQSFLKSVCY